MLCPCPCGATHCVCVCANIYAANRLGRRWAPILLHDEHCPRLWWSLCIFSMQNCHTHTRARAHQLSLYRLASLWDPPRALAGPSANTPGYRLSEAAATAAATINTLQHTMIKIKSSIMKSSTRSTTNVCILTINCKWAIHRVHRVAAV